MAQESALGKRYIRAIPNVSEVLMYTRSPGDLVEIQILLQ